MAVDNLLLATKLFLTGFALWLGAYLLALRSGKRAVQLTGWGLIVYALALALEVLTGSLLLVLPLFSASLWVGASLHLWPDDTAWREGLIRAWILAVIPVLILTLLNAWFGIIVVLALLASAGMLVRLALQSKLRNHLAIIAVVTLFLALSSGLMVLPERWRASPWATALLGIDLLLLGFAITIWDAFDQGERFRAHLLRSFIAAFYFAGALAALIVIGIVLDGEMTRGKRFLLVAAVAFGILTQVFANAIQRVFDRLAFSHAPALMGQRGELREAAENLPRRSPHGVADLDEAEFARLTRRAISSLGDLSKLTVSPLTNLSIVTRRSGENPLDRAHTLKALLINSIQRLKPRGDAEFGVTDEWRYYNVLYFPYVMGLRPYARRMDRHFLDEAALQALDWFQRSVPERTLYNWQNTAAGLVARDLWDQEVGEEDWQ
jgi:MFS family permease